jgi:peroxiredoxin family protein
MSISSEEVREYREQHTQSAFDLPSSEDRINRLEANFGTLVENMPGSGKVTLLVFSGDLDKVLVSLILATTASSLGLEVTVFFTFWSINILNEKRKPGEKSIKEKMIGLMAPTGIRYIDVSHMNMLGAGSLMLRQMMKNKHIVSAEELMLLARDGGVKLLACSMTMQVMGI